MNDTVSFDILEWARDLAAIRRMVEAERALVSGATRATLAGTSMGARAVAAVLMPLPR